MHSMDSILSDEPSVHTMPETSESDSPAPETTPKTETKSEPAAKATAPQPSEPATKRSDDGDDDDQTPEDLEGLKRALKAARGDKRRERKKWHEVERELAELRGRFSAIQTTAQPQGEQSKAVSPEDEFYLNPVEALRKVEQRVVGSVQRQLREISVARMRAEHDDYEETVRDFAREVQGTPVEAQLNAQLANHPDPARLAYTYARNFKQLRGASSVEELTEKLRAEIRAEFEAGRSDRPKPPAPQPSIAGARGSGVSPTAQWTGPRSLDEILRR